MILYLEICFIENIYNVKAINMIKYLIDLLSKVYFIIKKIAKYTTSNHIFVT